MKVVSNSQRAVFMDTSAIVALFDKRDKHHSEAKALLEVIKKKRTKLLLSDYVFDESITTAMSNVGHDTAVRDLPIFQKGMVKIMNIPQKTVSRQLKRV